MTAERLMVFPLNACEWSWMSMNDLECPRICLEWPWTPLNALECPWMPLNALECPQMTANDIKCPWLFANAFNSISWIGLPFQFFFWLAVQKSVAFLGVGGVEGGCECVKAILWTVCCCQKFMRLKYFL